MLSPHQATYFLLMMEPIAVAPLAPGLPAAVAEMYATTGLVAMDADGQKRTVWSDNSGTAAPIGEVTDAGWLVGLAPLLADYWAAHVETLEAFAAGVREAGQSPWLDGLPPSPAHAPLVFLQHDEMQMWHAFIELDGSDDPRVYEHGAEHGWRADPPRFSAWLFTMFAHAYLGHDWAPRSFWGPHADIAASVERAPLQPFKSGRWLRGNGPALTEAMSESLVAHGLERDQRPFAAHTLVMFVAEDGACWVVTEPAGGAASWWVWADTHEALVRFAGYARAHVDGALIADSPAGRAALAALQA